MHLDETFLSASQYADLRGVTDSYIHHLRRAGRLVLDDRGRIAVRASDELIAQTRLRRTCRRAAGAKHGHPWATNCAATARDEPTALRQVIASALVDAANALAPRVAIEAEPAACRALLAQELQGAGKKITDVVLAQYHRISVRNSSTTRQSPQELDDE